MEFPNLKHPFSMMICGPSNSGKTFFVRRILETKLIKPFPPKIIWCYGIYQKLFEKMSDIEFHEGIPSGVENITNALIIIDDLMNEVGDDKKLSNLFTKGSHHRDISVIFILQNIFCKGKQIRNISLNTSYLCCFKNVRDKQQISCLARQMYPSQSKFLLESYDDATKVPYGYLFIDLKPETNERLRIRTSIFPGDKNIVYVPR
ncbi:uncharacterized protein TNCV_2567281 [Trichonephila clavipes]|uniref:Uncharacterized protein n=1 Tax=Trichonephila clavipes TaxID=2585209 RepID=A0A8X7BLT5_TRICX|nr:uncharacterized protein TNCV_1502931 [Trichonephila clavipes]GFY36766.1 uncharacterized protein TNCV_2567281 [Trichonephila clavipes]